MTDWGKCKKRVICGQKSQTNKLIRQAQSITIIRERNPFVKIFRLVTDTQLTLATNGNPTINWKNVLRSSNVTNEIPLVVKNNRLRSWCKDSDSNRWTFQIPPKADGGHQSNDTSSTSGTGNTKDSLISQQSLVFRGVPRLYKRIYLSCFFFLIWFTPTFFPFLTFYPSFYWWIYRLRKCLRPQQWSRDPRLYKSINKQSKFASALIFFFCQEIPKTRWSPNRVWFSGGFPVCTKGSIDCFLLIWFTPTFFPFLDVFTPVFTDEFIIYKNFSSSEIKLITVPGISHPFFFVDLSFSLWVDTILGFSGFVEMSYFLFKHLWFHPSVLFGTFPIHT